MKKNKKFKLIILELVVMGIMVGLIPDLLINGVKDIWGVCGFEPKVCSAIELQGAAQLILALCCNFIALFISFLISEEFNSEEE